MAELDVIVVGGGIAGLSCAWELAQQGVEVLAVEREPEPGGVFRTRRHEGFLYEAGPSTLVTGRGELDELIRRLGLSERQVEAEEGGRRWVVLRDRLIELPSKPPGFLTTPLLGPLEKLRVLGELFVGRAPADAEESVSDFVSRRLGGGFARKLAAPFVSGVYAGDPHRLAVRWALPRLHRLEVEHGGLIRGAFKRRKGPAPGGRVFSFRDGLVELPRELARQLGERLVMGTGVEELEPLRPGFRVRLGDGRSFETRELVLTVEAHASAELLAPLDKRAAALREVPHAPLAVVFTGWRDDQVPRPFEGFGYLVAEGERCPLLGCLNASGLFPGRAPEGMHGFTAFVGGAKRPELVELDDRGMLELVGSELQRLLGLRGDPEVSEITRWLPAIPQYEKGHGRFVECAEQLERELPGLHVAGSFISGVSVPDRVTRACGLACSLGQRLGRG